MMDSAPNRPSTAAGRRVMALLERRPVAGGILLAVVGVALVALALVWEVGPPGGLIVGAGGGAGLVLAFVGARALLRAIRSGRR